jgi:hypothetical protein
MEDILVWNLEPLYKITRPSQIFIAYEALFLHYLKKFRYPNDLKEDFFFGILKPLYKISKPSPIFIGFEVLLQDYLEKFRYPSD